MTERLSRPSQPLYDLLAPEYDAHFNAPHRRLYDELSWARVMSLLPQPGEGESPSVVVDAGCGIGRWARRLLEQGLEVVGIEQSPGMVAVLKQRPPGPGFTLVAGPMEDVDRSQLFDPDHPGAAVVLAMGSLQYTRDPESMVGTLASWLRPGGVLVVLVDSLVGLVLELLSSGRDDEALERMATHRGVWRVKDQAADLHLLDRDRLVAAFEDAGLVDVRASGLLVLTGPLGRDGLLTRAQTDYDDLRDLEAQLAEHPLLADAGKQLLVTGRWTPG